MHFFRVQIAALSLVAVFGASPMAALAKGAVWKGTVVHVSFDNLNRPRKNARTGGWFDGPFRLSLA